MRPGTIMFALAMFEWMRAILIVRRWSDDTEPDIALSRMNLEDFHRLRASVICAFGMSIMAQIMWWLP